MDGSVGNGSSALRAVVAQVAVRLTPGHGQPLARHLSLLSEADPGPAPAVWTDADAARVSTVLVARARQDALDDGMAPLTRYFVDGRLRHPSALSAGARAGLFASAAEYATAVGWPRIGAQYASESLLFAESPAERLRALGPLTLALALNAEFTAARAAHAEARRIVDERGGSPAELSHDLLLGQALLVVTGADSVALEQTADELDAAQPGDPSASFTAGMIRVTAAFIARDLTRGRALSQHLLHGSVRGRSRRLVRDLLTGAYSGVLALMDETAEAHRVLDAAVTQPGHTVCFAMYRAALLLQEGRDRELIASTDACVTLPEEHCLGSLTPVLTRRAVAFLRIGEDQRAATSMESALLLVARTGGSVMPLLMIPRVEAERLLDLVARTRTDFADTIEEMRQFLPMLASTATAATAAAALTPTERELAGLLVTELDLAEIARRRHVSVNTVKTQVRSIYAKLGVSRRSDALPLLIGLAPDRPDIAPVTPIRSSSAS
ncbi:hypothetical protein DBR36_14995 [Microbacterium sp. HMWF026]|uniref:helix-turn-helix domain-containing protein n=1 Tax=Microbacterium sp. HMWF026 TaxID=2056861 RepID=UPI000D361DE6|nr:helix-turn-helix transcriptional regulator [Microbacterium sp. HMWF026]PTT15318.1 hypothetical protein DBR36_14995 [Microbacterium sp. HMWF026]